ncbi:ATP-binding protein [Candidatus Pelagibacter sp.]|nr:ATP-binding protein [Candidatus Pelagibacter sp.]
MRKRIIRHLNQRSEMLSGISHDLRTPLTRIKLQLAFIKDKELSNKLSDDVIEMEKMLNEYLQFSKNRSSEKGKKFNISKLLTDAIKKYNNENISTEITPNILFHGKKNLLNRSISNILDNSLKYGKIIKLKLKKGNNNIIILVDDDGPGIPKNEYENVFKPFYKIDKSRSETKSSVGLGMSIASDIIQSHGGNIKLDKSSMNGLQVRITLPF